MARVELTVEIAGPAADVFAYLTDVEKLPEWQACAVESLADGSLAEGSRIIERRVLFGRELETANPGGLLRPAGPAIAGAARQELQRDFERLNRILEGAAEE